MGSKVVEVFLENKIDVLAIGRKSPHKSPAVIERLNSIDRYIQMDMEDIDTLHEKALRKRWITDDKTVFIHFAWSGKKSLIDGEVKDQMENVTYCANAIKVAKKLGCNKFINVGTIEETFAENYLSKKWKTDPYHSEHGVYAMAKLASRDMGRLISYLEKIEYVHTRFSVLIDKTLNSGGYIHDTLKKILQGNQDEKPKNNQLFDFLPIEQGAQAFFLICKKGKNKADYFIGSGEPNTLEEYFTQLKLEVNDLKGEKIKSNIKQKFLSQDFFRIDNLKKDTGFVVKERYIDLVKYMVAKHG